MYQKKPHYEEENNERWLISYADFITLLFAFFVVLYATSEQNSEKEKKFEESVRKYLVKLGFESEKKTVNDQRNYDSPIESPINKYKKQNEKNSLVQNKIEVYLENNLNDKDINKIVQDITNSEVGVRLSLNSSSFFEEKSDRFHKDASNNLSKLGQLLELIGYRVYVEGHSVSANDDWQLSANRAIRLVKYFTDEYKIESSRLAAISYGSSRSISNSESLENERVDFLILTEDIGL